MKTKALKKMKTKILFALYISIFFCHFGISQSDTLKIEGKVIFLTADGVYFNFGQDDGVSLGDTVQIYRNAQRIETLFISLTSSKRAVARVSSEVIQRIKIGDVAVILKQRVKKQEEEIEDKKVSETVEKPAIAVPGVSVALERTEFKPKPVNFFGRIAFQDFSSFSGSGFNYHRPGFLFVFSSDRLFIDNLTFNIYARADYITSRTMTSKSSDFNFRVYQLSLGYKFGVFDLRVGRIFSGIIPGAGNTDGIQLSVDKFSTSFGIIAGVQPEKIRYALNSSNPKFSVFASRKFIFGNFSMYSTVSYSRVMKNKKLDEEFVYLQNNLSYLSVFCFYQSAQFDLNDISQGQKVKKLTPRNFFISASIIPVNLVSFDIGFSAYKNTYLFETMKDIPDSLFDRRIRKNLRGALRLRLPIKVELGMSGSVKLLENEDKGDYITTGYMSAYDVFSTGIDFKLGYSFIKSRFAEINNTEISFGRDFFNGILSFNLEASAYSYITSLGDRFLNTVLRSGLIFNISKRYSFIVDLERSWERDFKRFTIFAEIGYRF